MSQYEASLPDNDSEVANLLKAHERLRDHSVSLLPGDSIMARGIADILYRPILDRKIYNEVVRSVQSLIDARYVELRLDSRQEASVAVARYAAVDDIAADVVSLVPFDCEVYASASNPDSLLRRTFANAVEIRGKDDVSRLLRTREALRHPKLIILDISCYPWLLDISPFRALADEVGAYLAIDIGEFAGLLLADAYPQVHLVADFVIADTNGTLGGPGGAMILARQDSQMRLDNIVEQFMDEDYDFSGAIAKSVAIGRAADSQGASCCGQMIENARILARELDERGMQIVGGTTDTDLILVNLDGIVTGDSAVQRLLDVGILAGVSRAETLTASSSTGYSEVLCLGTAKVTGQGMGSSEMAVLAGVIGTAVTTGVEPNSVVLRRNVADLFLRFGARELSR